MTGSTVRCRCARLRVAACSEDPTEQNALLAPLPFLEVAVRETTITATDAQTFRKYVPMNGRYNLVGESDGYTAYLPMSFYSNLFPCAGYGQRPFRPAVPARGLVLRRLLRFVRIYRSPDRAKLGSSDDHMGQRAVGFL